MPRQARLIVPDVALHVIQRGHNRQACFRHETDDLVYLTTLGELLAKSACALHAYCLMTNHVHMLLTRRYERTGALCEGRFRSCLVDSARYVIACQRYVELNPVRAGMVPFASAYRWSSHNGNAGRVPDKLLTPHREFLALANDDASRHAAYQSMLSEADEPAFLAAIRDATNGGFALVGDALKSSVQADTGRCLERRKPGPAPARASADVDRLSGELGF